MSASDVEEEEREEVTQDLQKYYKVSSEVTGFTRGETLNGSTGNPIYDHGDVMAPCQRSNNVSLTGNNQVSQRSCKRIDMKNKEEEEEKERMNMEDEELFECLLGANGQVVLWSPHRETVISRFDFVYPAYKDLNKTEGNLKVTFDKDGDIEVIRKNQLNKKEDALLIEHQNATVLDLVGEQIWAAALYLADFILQNPSIFSDKHVLELAAGVGLTSVVAGMFAKKVTVTDIDRGEILDLIRRNIKRNYHLLTAKTEVKIIDFVDPSTVDALQDTLKDVTILIAADVIYSNPLTDGFINTVLRLMSEPPNKTLYLAMEKRYVFTMEDMDAVAPCYEYLCDRLEWLRCQNLSRVEWTVEVLDNPCEQYFTYERNKHLTMWKIQARLIHIKNDKDP